MAGGLFGKLFGRRGEAAPPRADEPMIEAYDAHGRRVLIAKTEWAKNVLPGALQENWNSPSGLYGVIVGALGDGLAAEVEAASSRLLEIDQNAERAATIRGIVQMDLGRLDAAEAALRDGMARAGETGILLTNLAKTQDARGQRALAEETLWRGLHADPNQDNGLLWWLALQQERDGAEGYRRALARAAALAGAWRPQLWQARLALDDGDVATAERLYREVLGAGGWTGDALTQISGDLGQRGHAAMALDLVGAYYDPATGDVSAGLNLLECCQETGRHEEGARLLDALYRLEHPALRERLDGYAAAFLTMAGDAKAPQPLDLDRLEVVGVPLDLPVWAYNLQGPGWLIGEKPADGPRVCVVALSRRLEGPARSESHREDEAGRISRATALYLAEAIREWTDYRAVALIHAVPDGGPVLFGAPHDPQTLDGVLPEGTTHVVTGEVAGRDGAWSLSLSVWERNSGTTLCAPAVTGDVGPGLLRAEAEILARLGRSRSQPFEPFYRRPRPAEAWAYLLGLAQSLTLTLTASGYGRRDQLFGERSMLAWPLDLAVDVPDLGQAPVWIASDLAKARRYESTVLPEFAGRALQLVRASPEGSILRGLAPLFATIFARAEFAAFGSDRRDGAYADWRGRLRP